MDSSFQSLEELPLQSSMTKYTKNIQRTHEECEERRIPYKHIVRDSSQFYFKDLFDPFISQIEKL